MTTLKVGWGVRLREWLFQHLFPTDYEHMTHLVDDVIKLELRLQREEGKDNRFDPLTYSDSNSKTYKIKEQHVGGEDV